MAMLVTGPAAHAGLLSKIAIGSTIGYAVHSLAKQSGHPAATTAPHTPRGEASCSAQFPFGQAPTITNPKLAAEVQTICYSEYTVAVSGKTRTPLWAAEFLTRQRIQEARRIKRVNSFHEEPDQASAQRAHLKDYVGGKPLERGHLAPSGDMSNPDAQFESYSLANIIPQHSANNRHVWEGIESGTRQYAMTHGEVYVTTGPLFIGSDISFLNGRVAVPTRIFKLLYDPVRKSGGVYVVDNIDTQNIDWMSIPVFEKYAAYSFNLGSPALMPMPKPQPHF